MKRAPAVLAILASVACGPPLMKLPSGPGVPAPEAEKALAQATSVCVGVRTLTAEAETSGSVGGNRLRARLLIGVATPASARIEAVAAFGPVFVFVAQNDDATLLLTHDDRVLEHGAPPQVLEAIAGVPLGPADLRTTISGCASGADPQRGRMIGDDWVVIPGITEVYLHRDRQNGLWRLVAAVHGGPDGPEWRAEYRDFNQGLPHSVRIVASDARRFDLRLVLSQVETNVALDAEAFRVRVPPSAVPITLKELRESGPLGDSSAHGR
jgi:hypothetical protein